MKPDHVKHFSKIGPLVFGRRKDKLNDGQNYIFIIEEMNYIIHILMLAIHFSKVIDRDKRGLSLRSSVRHFGCLSGCHWITDKRLDRFLWFYKWMFYIFRPSDEFIWVFNYFSFSTLKNSDDGADSPNDSLSLDFFQSQFVA